MPVPGTGAGSSVRDRKIRRGNEGRPPALARAREHQQSDRGRWQTGGVKVIWNLGYPVRIKEIGHNLYDPPKQKNGAT